MDADQPDLMITGHVVTPGQVLEDGWSGVRGDIVARLGPADSAAPAARQVIDARASGSCPEEWTEPDDIAVCLAALTAVVIRLDEELAP